MMILKIVTKIENLIDAEINNGPKDYDREYIRKHVEKINYLAFHILSQFYNTFPETSFEALNSYQV